MGRRGVKAVVVAALLGLALGWATAPPAAAAAAGGHVMTYGTAGDSDTGAVIAAGTNPSIAGFPDGSVEIAYQATDGLLHATGAQTTGSLQIPMAAGTSPAITALTTGSYEVAVQNSASDLQLTGGAGTVTAPIGMAAGTSPTITPTAGGEYQSAVEANDDTLRGWGSLFNGDIYDVMAPGTSPAIAAQGSDYAVAYEGTDTSLNLHLSASGSSSTGEGMHDPSSAAMGNVVGGPWVAAFITNADQLYLEIPSGPVPIGAPAAGATNPSVAGLTTGGYEAAFHGADGDLWLDNSTDGVSDTGEPMADGSSPSVAALGNGGFEVAYEGPAPVAPSSAPAPAAAPVTVTPIVAHPTQRGHHHLRRIRTKIRMGWRWAGERSRLATLFIGRLPHHGVLSVSCAGRRGCGARRHRHVKAGHQQRMINALLHHVYRAGDRIRIEIHAPGYAPLRAVVEVRRGREPRVVVLKDTPAHHTSTGHPGRNGR